MPPVATPAAVADDVHAPADPLAREQRLLLAFAVCASLPRVVWGAIFDASRFLDVWGAGPALYDVLRWGGLALDVGAIVLLVRLRSLDRVAPAAVRQWAVALAVLQLGLVAIAGPLFAFVGGSPLGWFVVFRVPSSAALIALAVWLAHLLRPHGRRPLLVPVAVLFCFFSAGPALGFSTVPFVELAVGAAIAVEITRVRYSLMA